MKLHSLRLQNINSLRGQHTLDFEGDLGDAPLFLIHGPTGSGKSSLMDAISLALFASTARLGEVNVTGRDALGERDARNVMTRGTGECSATLVFSRLDGSRRRWFRASWGVHRARRRSDGNFQAVHREIAELASPDPERLLKGGLHASGSVAKHYQDAFEEALAGMTAEDFHRTMLLAQGEFTRFLHAGPKERSDILKRVVDTSRFLRIGERAAERWKEEKSALDARRSRLEARDLLSAEARAELTARCAEAAAALQRARQEREHREQALRWVETALALLAAHGSAQRAHEERTSAWENAAPDRKRLERFDAVAPALQRIAERDERATELRTLEEARQRIVDEEATARELESATAQAEKAAAAKAESATAAREKAAPAIRAARAAREDFRNASSLRATADREYRSAAAAEEAAIAAEEQARLAAAEARAACKGAESAWQSAEPWHALLAEQSVADAAAAAERFRQAHEAATARSTALHERDAAIAASSERIRTLHQEHAPQNERIAHAEAARNTAHAHLRERLAPTDPETPTLEGSRLFAAAADAEENGRALERALEGSRRAISGLQQRRASEEERAGALAATRSEKTEAEASLAAANDALEREVSALADLKETREQAESRERSARLQLAHLELREALAEGDPCVVCGSTSHPWAGRRDEEAHLEEQLREAADHLEYTRKREAERQAEAARLRELRAALQARITSLSTRAGEERKAQEVSQAAGRTEWREFRAQIEPWVEFLRDELRSLPGGFGPRFATAAAEAEGAAVSGDATGDAGAAGVPDAGAAGVPDAGATGDSDAAGAAGTAGAEDAPDAPEAPERDLRLLVRLELGLGEALEREAEARRALRAALAGARDADEVLDALRREADEARRTLEREEERLAGLKSERGREAREEERAGDVRRDAESALRARVAEWPSLVVLPEEPGSLREEHARGWLDGLRGRREEVRSAEAALRAAKAALEEAAAKHSASVAALVQAKEERKAREAALALADGRVAELRTAMEKHLDGEDPDRMEEALLDAEKEARAELESCRRQAQDQRSLQTDRRARIQTLGEQAETTRKRLDDLAQQAEGALEVCGCTEEEALAARLDAQEAATLRARVGELQKGREEARIRSEEALRRWAEHLGACPDAARERVDLSEVVAPGGDSSPLPAAPEALRQQQPGLEKALAGAREEERRLTEEETRARVKLEQDDAAREEQRRALDELAEAEREAGVWRALGELIGTRGGAKFEEFAQTLILDRLLMAANRHLKRLRPRYRFVRPKGAEGTFSFSVEDRHCANEVRPLTTLSGGETFLASLALALGLAGMQKQRLPMETLLLDEGFGTLDGASLDDAITVLEGLHADGYRVGLISHVEALRERIAGRIEVRPTGGGFSEVRVCGGPGSG